MRFPLMGQIRHELRSVARGYPDFVYSGRSETVAGHVPLFVYHTVRPDQFEEDLRFLERNGYRTWGMTELLEGLAGSREMHKVVVLTFDDARSSFWRYAFPLLERHGMKGVLFANPGLTLDAPSVRPSLLSVWDGNHTPDEIERLDPKDTTLCTWPEIKTIHGSGRIDVESHSLFHQEVFVGTEVLDFLLQDSTYVPFATTATAYLSAADVGEGIRSDRFFGLPVFRTASLYQGLPFWEVPSEVRRNARSVWREVRSGASSAAAARRLLFDHWAGVDWSGVLKRQTTADVERRVTDDINTSRLLLKERVGPATGDHFCLPYAVGSRLSIEIMERLGIKSCSWGVMPEKRHNSPGDSPMELCRIKADFIRRLPGSGRRSLARVYGRKAVRRIRGDRVY